MIWLVNTKKEVNSVSVSVVLVVGHILFDAIDPSSSLPFAKLFFSLFKSHIASERHLFSTKMKEIIKKLKIKYWIGLG